METKYYVDYGGVYLGGFCGAEPPAGAIQIPEPPPHASDVLVNGVWVTSLERVKQEIRAARSPVLSILDGMQASCLATGDSAGAQTIEVAKQSLKDITAIPFTSTTYDGMRYEVLTRYHTIAAQLPAQYQTAFLGVAT